MMKKIRYFILTLLSLCMMLFVACGGTEPAAPQNDETVIETETAVESFSEVDSESETYEESVYETEVSIDYDGVYTSKEDVALYLYTYGELPQNFITKKEAKKLGWEGGYLEPYAPGMCIGGDTFGNYEGILPDDDGITYKECDIDTLGAKKRGAKRIVFSNEGDIYYTEDHYESFVQLYGDDME